MSEDINLLRRTNEGTSREKTTGRILQRLAYFSLALVALSLLGIFFLKLQSPLPELKKEEHTARATLKLMDNRVAKHLFVVNRLKDISEIVSSRSSFEKTIDVLTKGKPGTIRVTALSIGKKTITLSASSKELTTLQEFFDYLVDLSGHKKELQKVSLQNISFDGSSNYYTVLLDMKPK